MILDKKMRVFLATAEAGSFSRAARQLSLSQSVVSFHIKALEQELGVSLFRRQGRSISLTAEGKLLFEKGRALAKEARRIEDAFAAQSEKIAQRIYLAGDALTCAFTIPWTLAAFRADYPDVRFTYEHLDEGELINRLVSGELDVALVGHPVAHRKLAATPCFQDKIVLVGPASSAPDSLTIDQLRETPIIWATNDRGLELLLSKKLPEAGLQPKDLNVFMEVDGLPILKTFVRAGVGMTFLPFLSVLDEVRFDLLKVVDVLGLTLERTNYLVHLKERTLRPIVTALVEFVENRDWEAVLEAQGRGGF